MEKICNCSLFELTLTRRDTDDKSARIRQLQKQTNLYDNLSCISNTSPEVRELCTDITVHKCPSSAAALLIFVRKSLSLSKIKGQLFWAILTYFWRYSKAGNLDIPVFDFSNFKWTSSCFLLNIANRCIWMSWLSLWVLFPYILSWRQCQKESFWFQAIWSPVFLQANRNFHGCTFLWNMDKNTVSVEIDHLTLTFPESTL